MEKITWRLTWAGQALQGTLTGKPIDWGVVAFFMTPGSLRNALFGPTYVARRFLRKFGIGDIEHTGAVVHLTIADIQLDIPVHGFEQGDVFDILLPYALTQIEGLEAKVQPYLAANTNRFYDGPYVTKTTPLKEGMTVVDAGASMGLFTITASKFVGTTGRIIACEPIAEARAFLEKNIASNNCTNITVIPAALGEATKIVQFDVSLDDHFEGSSKYINRHGAKRDIQQYTLDDVLAQQNIEHIDFLKADIEGSERDLLTGAKQILSSAHPLLAIRTYHLPDDTQVIPAIIESVGGYTYTIVGGTTLYGHAS
jgi:FkbM family methyltransferase